jgi:FMN phosphatase YigB (HAD superfamily)
MTSPAPTLIFDLGGVLVRHDDAFYDRLAPCFANEHDTRPKVTARLGGNRGGR